ncbi:hypothetical protein BFP76_07415 [Amylibacter kogurei]|uniref:Endolytic murein transglycosylase n=1 Tax=Paramylibacter kogurei TaxID=1889778 RepID=A0A2G5K616_9RHOB|nr:endolytic transglycosylase MltG [Amylibacter kogurei]PIB24971.1 hypothetical protein BFP76_07415 [Amylibacter kogurei]
MFARHIAANFVNLLIVLLIAGGVAILWGKSQFNKAGPLTQETEFAVNPNDRINSSKSKKGVAERLEDAGIISDASIFRAGAKYLNKNSQLKVGDYVIPEGASMAQVLDIVNSGVGISQNVTFPEGWTNLQIVERLMAQEQLTGEVTTLPPEGGLSPNTYAYNRADTRQSIIDKMVVAQQIILDEVWENRADDLFLKTKEEALIVASIIEGETPVKEELRLVSGVIINRLQKGTPLGMDSTTVYEFTGGDPKKMRDIRRSDLLKDTPYNTRRFAGLPPTPIGNPSRRALEAAVNPEKTDFMFFVADGTGGHAFAKTLAEHNKNVANWRRIERQQAADRAKANDN